MQVVKKVNNNTIAIDFEKWLAHNYVFEAMYARTYAYIPVRK